MKRLKNYILIIFVVILGIFCLSSCEVENENYEEYKPTQGSMFVCIERYEDPYLGAIKILVDRETKIMYMYATKAGVETEISCITVLYDSDGKPKKYNGVISE